MPTTSAELKGSLFPLSILVLEDNDLDKLQQQLDNKLKQAPAFFFRAPLVVNIEQVSEEDIDFLALKQAIEAKDFICVGVCNGSTDQKKQARIAGLATLQPPKATEARAKPALKDAPQAVEEKPVVTQAPLKAPDMIVRQNVRSGQQIYAKNADLIVVGSVGNGAEVIADGSIHIYGKLRGRALAGASGNKGSSIFCQSLEAELVSVAGNYWVSDAIEKSLWQQSGIVKLDQEQLTIEPLLDA
ncbi:septum site-determining protein MinC [Psychrobium sp. nBUS_13]|jgi:septum site-determining protein MinC|uniref:septum site-determining protein MinC n=1 Tax=Psychrobium sp. nBUS_13 TaxID=3395319 RepID=UPI003EC0ACBE